MLMEGNIMQIYKMVVTKATAKTPEKQQIIQTVY
jgi:hypothetical protein